MKNLFTSKIARLITSLVLILGLSGNAMAQNKNLDLDALLKQLEEGQFQQSEANKQREADFKARVADQDQIIANAVAEREAELATSDRLETTFEENDFKIADLKVALNDRLGTFRELFGVLQLSANSTAGAFKGSVISAEIPRRHVFLEEFAQTMGKSSKLASIEEMEQVWFEIQREMTESGKVVKFNTQVVQADGTKTNKEVTRVGSFALIADGKYLEYLDSGEVVAELTRQPQERYSDAATALEQSNGELVAFGVDPTGGSILKLLVQAPNLEEKVEQGGLVGYIILGVGAFGFLLAIIQLINLSLIQLKVNAQQKSDKANANNPLGRVLLVKDKYPDADVEALELHLTEAILGELPKLTRFLTIVKIISVVAPLMGLLGTVTGMINTFQAITLFGTGDPKMMAGGISQALVTTVLGLVVAIPTTLLYAFLNTRSKGIVAVLQEQSSGVIAERAERG